MEGIRKTQKVEIQEGILEKTVIVSEDKRDVENEHAIFIYY